MVHRISDGFKPGRAAGEGGIDFASDAILADRDLTCPKSLCHLGGEHQSALETAPSFTRNLVNKLGPAPVQVRWQVTRGALIATRAVGLGAQRS
jgi:hypothetical protein